MTHRRKRRSHWTDSLPDDMWTHEPKVHLYRLEHLRKPRYLGTHLAFMISLADVAGYYGGGCYRFVAVHQGRVIRRGSFEIEGNPIR